MEEIVIQKVIKKIKIFKIDDKTQKFLKILGKSSINDLDRGHIVIVLPRIYKSKRLIHSDDKAFFQTQENDARVLTKYIMQNSNADFITIFTSLNTTEELITKIKQPINYLILLHEFTDFEKNYVFKVLMEYNFNIKHIELS